MTGHFSGWQCDGGVSLRISNQETPYLVALVLGKLNPGKSFDWHVLGFEVQEINVHKVTNAGKKKESWLQRIEIRENQRTVVEGYVSGRDFLMVAPTGSGKAFKFFKSRHSKTYIDSRNDLP